MHQLNRLLFLIILIFSNTVYAQVCTGTLGNPVINIDFGAGPNYGPRVPSSGYPYIAGTPNDGAYTVANSTRGMNSGWFTIDDHTPGDVDGYMMVINADNSLGVFYETRITGLCPGTTYEFAAWIVNILNYSGIKPNVTFSIETTSGTVLKSYNTGDILESSTAQWKQYATLFTTTNDTEIVLKITNNGPRGAGNDLALDDITFRACGPKIVSSINSGPALAGLCEGQSGAFDLSANVSSGYLSPVYQWQEFKNNAWVNIPGQTTTTYTASFINAQKGSYRYQLLVAESGNINSTNCRIVSDPFIVTVYPLPNTVAGNNGPVCIGATIQLTATEATNFSWTGPNGFSSVEKNPSINLATKDMAGTYTVTASTNGCTVTAQTTVVVLDPVESRVNISQMPICENTSVQLEAFGGTSYSWLPVEGLSDPNISNPVASPKESTLYTVTVSNGACSNTQEIKLNVFKNPVANAGPDKKILTGQATVLDGKVSGTDLDVGYYWTPADYLDDPTKLNPVASPPTDITYTLHTTSILGCPGGTDDVFIKVYPKIEISNTFSPNGDGINDTWTIPAAEAFPNARVKIVNRNGNLVFQSNGMYIPWDGKFNGKDLPTAVYYYTIYFNADFDLYSGWLLLTR